MTIPPISQSHQSTSPSIQLLYITNDPEIAVIAEAAGVDRVFVDLEVLGKATRQGHLDTVRSNHTIEDVSEIRHVLQKSALHVRVNPLNKASDIEIDAVISAGADVVMLPYFQTASEAARFIEVVAGRARTCLLIETPSALNDFEAILDVPGIDEVHFGLNDLHLGLNLTFMFELLTNGQLEGACRCAQERGLPFGIGGVGKVGAGPIPAEYILGEHHRLGSSMAILSRSFCDHRALDAAAVRLVFERETPLLRGAHQDIGTWNEDQYSANNQTLRRLVAEVCARKRQL